MRAAVRTLDALDGADARAANLLAFCDTDVVLRNPALLTILAGAALHHEPALLGEVRHGVNPEPDIQASFFVVRRDVYRRRDIAPLVHHGSPAYWLQRSIRRAGLSIVDFPGNRDAHLLHRGRSGVAAANEHRPRHPYASVVNRSPHFMRVPDGAAIWAAIEGRWAELLGPTAEDRLLELLAGRFAALGTVVLDE